MSEFFSYKYFLDNEFKNWDPDKFDWKDNSKHIAEYCSKYINIWWDTKKFNWEKHTEYLVEYCKNYFDVWWDPKNFNWEYIYYLSKYCDNHFEKWYDEKTFDNKNKHIFLLYYCFQNINKWWNLDKIVKYFDDDDVDFLIEENNKYNLLDKAEIIKLKLLRS